MPPPETTPTALIAIVIPTCNRLEDLARCLDSLMPGRQAGIGLTSAEGTAESGSKGASYQVIVTDDGRRVAAEALVRERFPWAQWTQGPGRGPAANRNHGVRQATGEWVVFIDDDCVASPGWLAAIARHAINPALEVIEGRTIIPDKRDNPFLHGVENETGGCYWSCNLAVRRSPFLDIGGFDEAFLQAGGEDMEFAWRFQQRGLRPFFEPDALVLHPQRRYSVAGFLKRVPLLKWSLLHYQKTGQVPPEGSSTGKIASAVVRRHLTSLARQTWRDLVGRNPGGWRTRCFNMAWAWLVLPYQLPHLLWWEFQFRRDAAKPVSAAPP